MKYLPWELAGGPNECAHGYAEGVPCPDCDRETGGERKGRCPFCRRWLLFNDDTLTISHQIPECASFKRAIETLASVSDGCVTIGPACLTVHIIEDDN
jgi:hypothetical protein